MTSNWHLIWFIAHWFDLITDLIDSITDRVDSINDWIDSINDWIASNNDWSDLNTEKLSKKLMCDGPPDHLTDIVTYRVAYYATKNGCKWFWFKGKYSWSLKIPETEDWLYYFFQIRDISHLNTSNDILYIWVVINNFNTFVAEAEPEGATDDQRSQQLCRFAFLRRRRIVATNCLHRIRKHEPAKGTNHPSLA